MPSRILIWCAFAALSTSLTGCASLFYDSSPRNVQVEPDDLELVALAKDLPFDTSFSGLIAQNCASIVAHPDGVRERGRLVALALSRGLDIGAPADGDLQGRYIDSKEFQNRAVMHAVEQGFPVTRIDDIVGNPEIACEIGAKEIEEYSRIGRMLKLI